MKDRVAWLSLGVFTAVLGLALPGCATGPTGASAPTIQASFSKDQHKVSEERWDPVTWQMWVDSQGGP